MIIDPFDPEMLGIKLPKDMACDIVIKSHDHPDHNRLDLATGDPIQIAGPGEYEVKGVAVTGVPLFHDKSQGSERGKNTVYNIEMDGLNIVHLGDIGHTLTDEQTEQIDQTDILLIPVGGTYTIDASDAAKVVSQLEPKIIIPMHYGVEGSKIPLDGVDKFLKEMGAEAIAPLPKLSITRDKLPEEPQIVILSKS